MHASVQGNHVSRHRSLPLMIKKKSPFSYDCDRPPHRKLHRWAPDRIIRYILESTAPVGVWSFSRTTRKVALARAMTTSSALTKHCAKQIVLPVLITSGSTASHCPTRALPM